MSLMDASKVQNLLLQICKNKKKLIPEIESVFLICHRETLPTLRHREAHECELWWSSWSQIGNFCCPGLRSNRFADIASLPLAMTGLL